MRTIFIALLMIPFLSYSDTLTTQTDSISKARMGGRSKKSIYDHVMKYIPEMKRHYNERLRTNPCLLGRITYRFAIDEFGSVTACNKVSSTVNDSLLEDILAREIFEWKFGTIPKVGDITEVSYPFVFDVDTTDCVNRANRSNDSFQTHRSGDYQRSYNRAQLIVGIVVSAILFPILIGVLISSMN